MPRFLLLWSFGCRVNDFRVGHLWSTWVSYWSIPKVSSQNGISGLQIIVEIYLSGWKPSIYIYVMSCVPPTGWLAVLHCKYLNVRHYTQTVLPNFCHTSHAYRHHWLPPFYADFTDVDLAWGSQGQLEAKAIGLIFLHPFHLIRINFEVVMKQFKVNVLRLLLIESYWNKGNTCCFTDCIKNCNIS